MNDETIWQGATYESTITDTELTAETARLTLKNTETGDIIPVDDVGFTTITVKGVELRAATFYVNNTDTVGEYSILYTVEYSDGTTAKFPAPSGDCEGGDCDLPTLTICEASDEETS